MPGVLVPSFSRHAVYLGTNLSSAKITARYLLAVETTSLIRCILTCAPSHKQSVTSSIFLGSRRQECHSSHPREDTSNSSISRGHESEVGAHWVQDRGLQNLPQKGSRKLPRFRPMPCHDAPSQQLPIHPGQLDYLIPSGRHLVGLSAICAGSGDQTARGMRPILAGVGTGSRYQGRYLERSR